MKTLLKIMLVLVLLIGYLVGSIYWFQADKEVGFLCSYFDEGRDRSQVEAFINTLQMAEAETSGNLVTVRSINLGNTTCRFEFSAEGTLVGSEFRKAFALGQWASVLGSLALLGLVIFQVLLAAGKPLGERAWGGQHKVLPQNLRIGSGISAVLLLFGIVVMLNGGGFLNVFSGDAIQYALGAFCVMFALSAVGNAASKSKKERQMGVPLALVIFASFFTVMTSMW